MSTPLDTIKTAIIGSPFDPNKKPSRQGVIKAFAEMQRQLEGAQAGAIVRGSKANLDLTVAAPFNAMAWVVGDSINANNGIYRNSGTAMAATWVRIADIPQFFISGVNTGEGSADAIRVTTDLPVPVEDGRCMIAIPIISPNTVSPPTVRINGGQDLPIVSNSGANIAIGGLIAGMIVVGFVADSKFRLITNQVDAAIVAQAEAAADRAEAAAETASGGWTVEQFRGDGNTTTFVLVGSPGTANNCFITVDNVPQLRNSYSISGNNLLFTQPPPGDGQSFNIEVAYAIGTEISSVNPVDGSVTWAKLAAAIIASQSDITNGTANKLVSAATIKQFLDALQSADYQITYDEDNGAAQSAIVIPLDTNARYFDLDCTRIEPTNGGARLRMQFSFDGGNTFTSSNYYSAGSWTTSADTSHHSLSDANVNSHYIGLQQLVLGGNNSDLKMRINPTKSNGYHSRIQWNYSHAGNGPSEIFCTGSGHCRAASNRPTHVRLFFDSGNVAIGWTARLKAYRD